MNEGPTPSAQAVPRDAWRHPLRIAPVRLKFPPHHPVAGTVQMRRIRRCFLMALLVLAFPSAVRAQWGLTVWQGSVRRIEAEVNGDAPTNRLFRVIKVEP